MEYKDFCSLLLCTSLKIVPMNLNLKSSIVNPQSEIKISGSKSETNRMLILQALYPNITLENASNSDDSEVMIKALKSTEALIDVHHAGTTMRFLAAYFSMQEGREVVLTGSPRMKERPIEVLVEALRQLDAEIDYLENEGFPPLKIKGKKITKNKVTLKADVSSQYISALLLVASKLENGLELTLDGEITSVPYINMTLALLNQVGIESSFENNIIKVNQKSKISNQKITIESDWSSASYFYSIVALADINTQITLSSYNENSLQGDSALVEIYKEFGVDTFFEDNKMILRKRNSKLQNVNLNLQDTPDIAQTIAVTCFGFGIGCHLTGLHTLKIKETDRLVALEVELSKLGAQISVTNNSLTLEPSPKIKHNIKIKTYNDHRMAMAFAPLALKVPIVIENAEVVSKSYPNFWNDLEKIGFRIENI